MMRWHARLEIEYRGFKDIERRLELEDMFYTFFQNSYHMRDWLLNSGALTKKEFETEKTKMSPGLVRSMSICRDLCNGSKHLTIKNPSVDLNLVLSHITISQSDSPLKFLYLVEIPRYGMIQAIDIATECILFWKALLKRKSLL